MTHPATLLKTLEGRAKKRFGQHFLAAPGIVRQIISVAQLTPGGRVLELGPGLGVLTEALVGAGAQVTAVELDRDMAAFIRERLPAVTLVEGDAAALDLPALLDGGGWRCVANLPYNAGTRMITNMLAAPDTFDRLVVMVQKEVAERLVARAGDRKRGSLSVYVEARAEARICLRVPPGAFHPPPKVHSAVVDFRLHPAPAIGRVPVAFFDQVVRASFVQPRKIILNNLSTAFDRAEVTTALEAAGVEARARPATLSVEDFQGLANALRHAPDD